MSVWFIVLIVWLVGAVVSYGLFMRKWNCNLLRKVAFSLIWPLILPLYAIHYFYNKFK